MFNDLLCLDTLRGDHSTGVLKVNSQGEPEVFKKAIEGFDFVKLKKYDKFMTGGTQKLLLGHNRFATKGAINNTNAHPFTSGATSLVHNGSLSTWKHSLHNADLTDVDSEAICFNVQHEGIRETLKKLNGAFALGVYNEESKLFHIVRNDDRPMFIARVEGKDALIFASEAGFIYSAAERNGVHLAEEPWFLKSQCLISFDISKFTNVSNFEVDTEIEFKKPFVTPVNNNRWNRNNNVTGSNDSGKKSQQDSEKTKNTLTTTNSSKNTGGATSTNGTRKQRRVYSELKDRYSLSIGDVITCQVIEDLHPYQGRNNDCGHMTLTWLHPEDLDEEYFVHSFNVSKKELEGVELGDLVHFKVTSASVVEGLEAFPVPVGLVQGKLTEDEVTQFWSLFCTASDESSEDALGAEEETGNTDEEEAFIGPSGRPYPESKLKSMVKHGCCNCSNPIHIPDDLDKLMWIKGDNPVCPICVANLSVASHSTKLTIEEMILGGQF